MLDLLPTDAISHHHQGFTIELDRTTLVIGGGNSHNPGNVALFELHLRSDLHLVQFLSFPNVVSFDTTKCYTIFNTSYSYDNHPREP